MITRERMITSKVFAISEVPMRIAAAMEKRLFISKVPFLQSNSKGDSQQGVSKLQMDPLCVMLSKTQMNHHPKH